MRTSHLLSWLDSINFRFNSDWISGLIWINSSIRNEIKEFNNRKLMNRQAALGISFYLRCIQFNSVSFQSTFIQTSSFGLLSINLPAIGNPSGLICFSCWFKPVLARGLNFNNNWIQIEGRIGLIPFSFWLNLDWLLVVV